MDNRRTLCLHNLLSTDLASFVQSTIRRQTQRQAKQQTSTTDPAFSRRQTHRNWQVPLTGVVQQSRDQIPFLSQQRSHLLLLRLKEELRGNHAQAVMHKLLAVSQIFAFAWLQQGSSTSIRAPCKSPVGGRVRVGAGDVGSGLKEDAWQ